MWFLVFWIVGLLLAVNSAGLYIYLKHKLLKDDNLSEEDLLDIFREDIMVVLVLGIIPFVNIFVAIRYIVLAIGLVVFKNPYVNLEEVLFKSLNKAVDKINIAVVKILKK